MRVTGRLNPNNNALASHLEAYRLVQKRTKKSATTFKTALTPKELVGLRSGIVVVTLENESLVITYVSVKTKDI